MRSFVLTGTLAISGVFAFGNIPKQISRAWNSLPLKSDIPIRTLDVQADAQMARLRKLTTKGDEIGIAKTVLNYLKLEVQILKQLKSDYAASTEALKQAMEQSILSGSTKQLEETQRQTRAKQKQRLATQEKSYQRLREFSSLTDSMPPDIGQYLKVEIKPILQDLSLLRSLE